MITINSYSILLVKTALNLMWLNSYLPIALIDVVDIKHEQK